MNHLKKFKKLNRTHSHRRALYRNMIESLIKHEKITTTVVKAKEIRRIVEKIITRAKEKTLHNIRIVNRLLKDKKVLTKLFDVIGPRFLERNGGYTRIYKLGKRMGDGADLAILELLPEDESFKSGKKKVKDKAKDSAKDKKNKVKKKKEEKKEEKKETKVEKNHFSVYKKDSTNYSFNLLDSEGNIKLKGESYKTKEDVVNIIASIREGCDKAEVIDLESEEVKKVSGMKFEIYLDANEKFVFRLKSDSGEIIGVSERSYDTKENCQKEIDSIKSIVKESETIEEKE